MAKCEYLVAVGASAGGLDPCERFFDAAPTDRGFAYVVIQHLSPDFRSLMDELLARHSTMPIHRVEDGMEVEANTIYLNRPRQILTVEDGKFVLSPDEGDDVLRLPIDSFFEAMANDFKERAVGVILSGSGSDGSKGAREIKSSGGRVFVQSPSSAKFESMPMAVINSKIADGVAEPDDLPSLISRHISGEVQDESAKTRVSSGDPYADILDLLKERFGTNFQFYKPETTKRRLDRRLDLTGFRTLSDYYHALLKDRAELETIYGDLLIEVTSFFRDQEAFEEIEKHVIPDICNGMSQDHQIRMWVPGCASGEEAYSLAMLVAEYARENDIHFNLKILATDVHQRSLSAASAGIYSKQALAKVPQERVQRYFEETGDYYQVRQALRRAVVFSPHDLMADPPFTRMDLVSCRNVLIYLTEEAQRKVLTLFHFALRKEGVLFLGPSETTGKLSSEFATMSQRWRIFQKKRNVRIFDSSRPIEAPRTMRRRENWNTSRGKLEGALDKELTNDGAINDALHNLIGLYAPPGFLINRKGDLVHIFGDGKKYLNFKEGSFKTNLEDLLTGEVQRQAKPLLERFKHGIVVENATAARVINEESGEKLGLRLRQLTGPTGGDSDFAILSIEPEAQERIPLNTETATGTGEDDLIASYADRVSELEHALQANEETLQSTIEEMETSNEELQATNEELMSANEELQSTNEELHSVNEELYTVSAEHQRKIEELTEITSDMDHLLKSTNIGTIFLDADLHVRRFTPAAARTFNLIAQDIGRPISHITARFSGPNVLDLVDQVRKTHKPRDTEIMADGRAYLMRILPYVADTGTETGVVITTIDVNDLKSAKSQLTELTQFHSEILQDIGQAVFRWSKSTKKLVYCNAHFSELFDASPDDLVGTRTTALLQDTSWKAVEKTLKDANISEYIAANFRLENTKGEVCEFSGLVRAIKGKGKRVSYYQFTGRDVTAENQYIAKLEDVLEVDKSISDIEGDRDTAHFGVEEKRIATLIKIAKDYLGADTFLMTMGAPGETPVPATFDGIEPPADLPKGTYEKLERLIADNAHTSSTVMAYAHANNLSRDAQELLAETSSNRAILGPIVSKNSVIGRAAFLVSDDHDPDRRFMDLEISLVRIIMRWIGYIWERRRRIEDLRNASAELELIFNNVSSKIWYKDDKNRILRLNKAAADSMQLTVEEATGADTYDLFPEMAKKYHDDDLKVINSGQPLLGIVERYTPLNGTNGWVRTDKIPYVDPLTGARNLLVVASDVTELLEREEELKSLNAQISRERQRHQQLYMNTPAMMFSTDDDRRINTVNLQLATAGGYSVEEMINRPFDDFFRPLDPDDMDDRPAVLDHGTSDGIQPLLFRCKSGDDIEVELAGVVEDDHPDTKIRKLWVVQDVTDRNAALKSLNDQNAELAKLNDGLAQFAYAASHDLQEPLRKISQYGDLLQEEHRDNLGETGQYFVDVMTSSAQRMSSLIKNLLVFSSASKGDLAEDPTDLTGMVETAVEELKDMVSETEATVHIDPLPKVVCDPNLIQIVMTNMISNALKYRAPKRTPVITVTSTTDDTQDPITHTITFEDNGLGFDDGDAERIFEPFARLVPKSKVTGSGIGLAICRTICERHGWRISASGSKSKGAVFKIVIPVRKEE